jgi:hypothetical protein
VKFPSSAGPSRLTMVTINNNKSIGITCTGPITGVDVLATGNAGGDISPACNFTSCAAAGSTCGAQP